MKDEEEEDTIIEEVDSEKDEIEEFLSLSQMSFDGNCDWNVRASTFVPIATGSLGPQVAGCGGPRSPWV